VLSRELIAGKVSYGRKAARRLQKEEGSARDPLFSVWAAKDAPAGSALPDRAAHGILVEKHYLLIDYFWKNQPIPFLRDGRRAD
jgi:hypothetical protein